MSPSGSASGQSDVRFCAQAGQPWMGLEAMEPRTLLTATFYLSTTPLDDVVPTPGNANIVLNQGESATLYLWASLQSASTTAMGLDFVATNPSVIQPTDVTVANPVVQFDPDYPEDEEAWIYRWNGYNIDLSAPGFAIAGGFDDPQGVNAIGLTTIGSANDPTRRGPAAPYQFYVGSFTFDATTVGVTDIFLTINETLMIGNTGMIGTPTTPVLHLGTGDAPVPVSVYGGTNYIAEGVASNVADATIMVLPDPSPVVGSLTANPTVVERPSQFTLTANNVADTNPGGWVTSVAFYHETNGVAGLQVGGDSLVGTDTNGDDGWSTAVSTETMSGGAQKFYAQATDNDGLTGPDGTSAPSASIRIPAPPHVDSVSASPGTVEQYGVFTLTAQLSDEDPSVTTVGFYRESNGVAGLQLDSDTLVGTDASETGGWSVSVYTGNMALGTYNYYAYASDSDGGVSATGTDAVSATSVVVAAGESSTFYLSTVGPDGTPTPLNPDLELRVGDSITLYLWASLQSASSTCMGLDLVSTNPSLIGATAITVENPLIFRDVEDPDNSESWLYRWNGYSVDLIDPGFKAAGGFNDPQGVNAVGLNTSYQATDPTARGDSSPYQYLIGAFTYTGVALGTTELFLTINETLMIGSVGMIGTPAAPRLHLGVGDGAVPVSVDGAGTRYIADGVTGMLADATITVVPDPSPVVGNLTASPTVVLPPGVLTLTAGDVSDPDGWVVSMAFYQETNGIAGLQVNGDSLVGTDTNGADGWSTAVSTATMAGGTQTFYAQATDNTGLSGPADTRAPSAAVRVAMPPHVDSVSATPTTIEQYSWFTLTAETSDAEDNVTSVDFYRESNGVAGLQVGEGGDTSVGTDANSSGGWSATVSTAGLAAGPYSYYAYASDADGGTSAMGTDALSATSDVVTPGDTSIFYLTTVGPDGIPTPLNPELQLKVGQSITLYLWANLEGASSMALGFDLVASNPPLLDSTTIAVENPVIFRDLEDPDNSESWLYRWNGYNVDLGATGFAAVGGFNDPQGVNAVGLTTSYQATDPTVRGDSSPYDYLLASFTYEAAAPGTTDLFLTVNNTLMVGSVGMIGTPEAPRLHLGVGDGAVPVSVNGEGTRYLDEGVTGMLADATITVIPNVPPVVESLTASSPMVTRPDTFALTAIASDADDAVGSVAFYRESNGTAGLQVGGDSLITIDANGADGWSASAASMGLAAGLHIYYAQATDSYGATSTSGGSATSTPVTILNHLPVIDGMTASSAEILRPELLTLTPTGMSQVFTSTAKTTGPPACRLTVTVWSRPIPMAPMAGPRRCAHRRSWPLAPTRSTPLSPTTKG